MSRPLPFKLLPAAVVLVMASAAPSFAIDAFLQGREPGAMFGHSVADAGDINGDSRPDLIVGAPLDDTGGLARGRAFIWFGGTELSAAANVAIPGEVAGDRFGYAVAGIGDINNDSYDDVIIGAPYNDTIATDAGSAYVLFGGPNLSAIEAPDLILRGEDADDLFGWAVSKGGDLNDDNFPDVLVGAPGADQIGVGASGSVYLYLGANGTPPTSFARHFDGEIAGDEFGTSVSDVPDFKGTGQPAFVVGAPYHSATVGLDAGKAYLFYAGTSGALPSSTPGASFISPQAGSLFGWSVSQAGRFASPSYSSIAIGGPGYQGDRGVVRVYYGSALPGSNPSHNLQIAGETGGDRFGEAVTDIGDHSGSSRDDLLVGAPKRDQSGNESGHVYLFNGGGSYTSATQGTDIAASNPFASGFAGDHFGRSLSYAGDLDNDGAGDYIVGAPDANNGSNSVAGVAALTSSSGNIVPVLVVSFRQSWQDDGRTVLHFGGAAMLADEASVWTLTDLPRRLAWLDHGLERGERELSLGLSLAALDGAEAVELRWRVADQERSDRFALETASISRPFLHEPVPNPFNPSTVLRLELPRTEDYEVLVVDTRGRVVRHLAAGRSGPGPLELRFDGRDDRGRSLASGVYTVRLEAGRHRASVRALLLK